MKVTLINHTHAAKELLIFTKNTRLKMEASNMENIMNWTEEQKINELEYISNTIKSSWEFVDYTFMIEGVTRAFTHQFVRNRQGSYAQQTMRVLDVGGFNYSVGPSIECDISRMEKYCDTMETINVLYGELIQDGAEIEDARGILPTNIETNIVAKYNLRTMSELIAARSSPRTQKEFREVLNEMYTQILMVHPWAEMFLRNRKVKAAQELDLFIKNNADTDDEMGLIKLVDILRS